MLDWKAPTLESFEYPTTMLYFDFVQLFGLSSLNREKKEEQKLDQGELASTEFSDELIEEALKTVIENPGAEVVIVNVDEEEVKSLQRQFSEDFDEKDYEETKESTESKVESLSAEKKVEGLSIKQGRISSMNQSLSSVKVYDGTSL